MTAAALTDDARSKAADLVRWRSTQSGDTRRTMEAIARDIHVPFAKLWALRYRPPKDIGASIYAAIEAAHAAETARQADKFAAARAATSPRTALGRFLVRTAVAVGGEDPGTLNVGGGE